MINRSWFQRIFNLTCLSLSLLLDVGCDGGIDDEGEIEEFAEVYEWYGNPNTVGLRPLTTFNDEFGEDDNGTEGGCYEPMTELDCEMPELEEFCLELSEEDVELMYEATRLLQEAFEAEIRGDCCTALEKLDKLASVVTEEEIIMNLLAIRLMAQLQGDLETLQTAEALLQHLGYDVAKIGMLLFELPTEPPHSFEL